VLAEDPLAEVGNLTGVLAVLKAGERVV
jgi:hypothetical protein